MKGFVVDIIQREHTENNQPSFISLMSNSVRNLYYKVSHYRLHRAVRVKTKGNFVPGRFELDVYKMVDFSPIWQEVVRSGKIHKLKVKINSNSKAVEIQVSLKLVGRKSPVYLKKDSIPVQNANRERLLEYVENCLDSTYNNGMEITKLFTR